MKSDPIELELIGKNRRVHDLNLQGAALEAAKLDDLVADRLDLRSGVMRGVLCARARFTECNLESAKLNHSDWSDATIRACVLDKADAAFVNFDNARLEDSSAQGAIFAEAQFSTAKLSETDFGRADLTAANFNGAEGHGIDFRGACLSQAKLTSVQFVDSDFRGADLRDADLSCGVFVDADFRGALLDGACFDGADCSGAEFDVGVGPRSEAAQEQSSKTAGHDGPSPEAIAQLFKQLRNLNIAADSDHAEVDEIVRQLGDDSGVAESPDELNGIFAMFGEKLGESDNEAVEALAGMVQVVGELGCDWAPEAINALANSGDEPPAEIQEIMEKLCSELDLDDATSITDLISKLADRGRG